MPTREELLEALEHTWATRHRLAAQPGTHGARRDLGQTFDALLDQLLEVQAADAVGAR